MNALVVQKSPNLPNNLPQTFILDWKTEMYAMFALKYGEGNVDFDVVNDVLEDAIITNLFNPNMRLVNNYTRRVANTSLLDIYDFIIRTKPILAGNGVLFAQHSNGDNPEATWIANLMSLRKTLKKKMFQAQKDADNATTAEEKKKFERLYVKYNLGQGNIKIKINSLYGVLGYIKFMFYNIFLAQCVTATGQNIISSAACGFEAFITDNIPFLSMSEVRRFVKNCCIESQDNDRAIWLTSDKVPFVDLDTVCKRILKNCAFKVSEENESDIIAMITYSNAYARKLIMYKNNLAGLYSLPYFKGLIKDIMHRIPELLVPEIDKIQDSVAKEEFEEFWEFLRIFVVDEHPIYDRVRKNKYQSKKAVLYEDTDSNFLSLNRWVKYVENQVLSGEVITNNTTYVAVNLFGIILSRVVASTYETLTKSMNIDSEHRKLLIMKNEFYYSRILFVNKKKRYIGLQVIQEGNILKNGEGKPDIKGFDFIKSTTKPTLKKFYEDLSYEEILKAPEIDTRRIFRKIMQLESSIRQSLRNGDTQYFKQANVKRLEDYKNPFSTQGVKAVMIWNVLNPEYKIELPGDVDIVPINLEIGRRKVSSDKPMSTLAFVYLEPVAGDKSTYIYNDTKNLRKFQEKYPDVYDRLDKEILHNENPAIRGMGLSSIAKPKNPNIPIPEWFYDIMDADKIVNDGIKLYHPVLETLGLNILKTSSTTEHYSNMISI